MAFLLALTVGAWAQSVLESPPKIGFGNWVAVPESGPNTFRINFPSPIKTDYPANDVVPVHVVLPEGPGPFPSVVLLHFWGSTDQRTEFAMARRLAKSGIAGIIVELPYHLHRTPAGKRSGELAVQGDPESLIAVMNQAIQDIRRTVDWVETRPEFDAKRVGIMGTSLGGIVGSLAFAVEPRFAAYTSVLGGAGIADIFWKSSRLVREREQLRRKGVTRESLTELLKPIEPAEYLRKDDLRPSYVIAARYDTVMPASTYRKLIDGLGNVQFIWLDAGHFGGFFVQNSVMDTAAKFFQKTLFGEEFTAPARLYAPTIRILGTLVPGAGLQIGAGLDVWKSDANGSVTATFILTPKGPQGFIGARASQGLSLGLAVLPRRTTVGAMWSFIL